MPMSSPSASSATTALTCIGLPKKDELMIVSPQMVSGVSPSPSLAVLILVGVMGRPTLSQKALLTTLSAVHPVSRMRSSLADFDGSRLLVTSTGSDGEGLTLSLLLDIVGASS